MNKKFHQFLMFVSVSLMVPLATLELFFLYDQIWAPYAAFAFVGSCWFTVRMSRYT